MGEAAAPRTSPLAQVPEAKEEAAEELSPPSLRYGPGLVPLARLVDSISYLVLCDLLKFSF